MRRKTETTRQRIIDAAYECFWRAGYTRTSLDTIAERAGLTKRTLYGYFRSKDDLLAAVMSHHNSLAGDRLRRIGDRMPQDRNGLIESFFGQLAGWASATPRWSGSGFTRLVVELADLPGHPARTLARRVKATTEGFLAERLAQARVSDPGERAAEIMLLLEGAMALTLIHGHRRYIEAAAQAAKRLAAPLPKRMARTN
jgi:AcrR family transcriptional regulator